MHPHETPWPVSVAPMMERTDAHYRWLARRLSRHTLLYTEMVPTWPGAEPLELRRLDPGEKPIALQLGGSEPRRLAAAAARAADLGYDEVDLNCGCPSTAAHAGRFGACLMRVPEQVAECVAAMRSRCAVPVTVKHRIGVDDRDAYEDLLRFVDVVASAGCDGFVVHARKAWLSGLSPAQNRTVPPLRYYDVQRLAAERPHLRIEVNGGVGDLDQAQVHLRWAAGVMIGRAAYERPMMLAEVDRRFHGEGEAPVSLTAAFEAWSGHALGWVAAGGRLHEVTRHGLGLFSGLPGGRRAKGLLSTGAPKVADEAQARALLREAWACVAGRSGREDHPEPDLLAGLQP